mmetsp:Transcript_24383/g.50662  ORF Transcript_24383/g.50662 Transcript_24383/m.50662 type:complete len:369 (+) Transcript_24383:119-1225(+)
MLRNLKILDCSRVLAGPLCAQTLSSLGARVIKVEPPSGDLTRRWKGSEGGVEAYFGAVNRGKESVLLDLKGTSGRSRLRGLIQECDVVVHNYLPSVASKLGLDYSSCAAVNPKIIHASVSGYGADVNEPGYDIIASAEYGLTSCTGDVAPGVKPGVALVDSMAGLNLACGILSKVVERGEGRMRDGRVHTSLAKTCVAGLANVGHSSLNGGERKERYGNAHESIVPYQAFECANGWMVIGVGTDAQFEEFMGLIHLEVDPKWRGNEGRVKDREALCGAIEAVMAANTVEEWIEKFSGAKFARGKVREVNEALSCPKISDMVQDMEDGEGNTFRAIGSPIETDYDWGAGTFPPTLGQHTDSVMREFNIE